MKHDLFTAELPIEGSGFQKWGCRHCMKVWTVGYSDQLLHDRLTTEECPSNDGEVKS
jgi:hypothetical protein